MALKEGMILGFLFCSRFLRTQAKMNKITVKFKIIYNIRNTSIFFKSIQTMHSRFTLLLLLILVTPNQVLAIPPGFTTKNVKFVSNGDTLAGTILKPTHPIAALVIVHGSGQEKRKIGRAHV